jgi:fatty-acyl-CoA synthase
MPAGTMMNVPLTIQRIVERCKTELSHVEVVSRAADKSITRTTYGKVMQRAEAMARGLLALGIARGDRVATLMWNHDVHLTAYFGVPLSGAVLHTLNLRLHPDEIAFIANDAGDKVLFVDHVLLPLFEKFRAQVPFQKVFVVGGPGNAEKGDVDFEGWLATAPTEGALPTPAEDDALGMCYTSGTTGKPKGVVYTHKSTVLHSLVSALPDALSLSRADTILPVVPMFHVNAWGLPYTAAMIGAKQVHPGPHLDPHSVLDLMAREKVTVAAGVPTIWLGIRDALDQAPGTYKLQTGIRMIVGGSAVPEKLVRDFDRQGLTLLHAWGMTETSPIGLVSRLTPELREADEDTRYKARAKQGVPVPFVDVRVRNEQGDVPRDGKTSGEVLVRGPWITGSYFGVEAKDRFTEDGYFRTGDVANVDRFGFVQLVDRIADLIKSGGEWIATVELENALMGHPAVREAAVVGVPHAKWSERPIAAIVLKEGAAASEEELRAHLAPNFAKFWLPDAFVFMDAIPRTSAGKFKKTELREKLRGHYTNQ